MEKHNDNMMIYTFNKTDTVTVNAKDYQELIEENARYRLLSKILEEAIDLDSGGDPTIDFDGRRVIMTAFKFIEPESFKWRVRQLKGGEADA